MSTPLIAAVIHNDANAVKEILSGGANPNACQDVANVTPLHFAAQHNSVEVVHLLITAGAYIHALTIPDGQTPLDIARIFHHEEVRAVLEDYSKKIPFGDGT